MGASSGEGLLSWAKTGAAESKKNRPKRVSDRRGCPAAVIFQNPCWNRLARTTACREWEELFYRPERPFHSPLAPGLKRAPPQLSSWPRLRLPVRATASLSATCRGSRLLPVEPAPARHS